MYETLLAEWHLSPDYIINNWTDELLALMCDKLGERRQREADAIRGAQSGGDTREVPAEELFQTAGNMVKVVK